MQTTLVSAEAAQRTQTKRNFRKVWEAVRNRSKSRGTHVSEEKNMYLRVQKNIRANMAGAAFRINWLNDHKLYASCVISKFYERWKSIITSDIRTNSIAMIWGSQLLWKFSVLENERRCTWKFKLNATKETNRRQRLITFPKYQTLLLNTMFPLLMSSYHIRFMLCSWSL